MMAALFFASSLPTVPRLPGDPANYAAHFSAYFVLGVLLVRAFAGGRWSGVGAGAAVRAWVVSAVYGATDELHQRWVPGRYPAVDDWVADVAGAAVGIAIVLAVGMLRARTGTPEP